MPRPFYFQRFYRGFYPHRVFNTRPAIRKLSTMTETQEQKLVEPNQKVRLSFLVPRRCYRPSLRSLVHTTAHFIATKPSLSSFSVKQLSTTMPVCLYFLLFRSSLPNKPPCSGYPYTRSKPPLHLLCRSRRRGGLRPFQTALRPPPTWVWRGVRMGICHQVEQRWIGLQVESGMCSFLRAETDDSTDILVKRF